MERFDQYFPNGLIKNDYDASTFKIERANVGLGFPVLEKTRVRALPWAGLGVRLQVGPLARPVPGARGRVASSAGKSSQLLPPLLPDPSPAFQTPLCPLRRVAGPLTDTWSGCHVVPPRDPYPCSTS